ncbi:OmpA family protein [Abyssibacter profundi]|uniref:Flagellar motor protein MotD n=1 Tax=Abyssibacter profundi TaxID=2182787 RepID=A0A383XQR7_9GAMM|nr:OmpA family protein [Abyssibacter profundi]PWN54971.1 flagellar motor protein MotD [Abyssibacter profundi]
MARRRSSPIDEHANTESWAIPYGDLVTLLLAFFVVMYATSTANEGKYRVLSDALNAAFAGAPRTIDPTLSQGTPMKAGQHLVESPSAFDSPTFAQSAAVQPATRHPDSAPGVTTLDLLEEAVVRDLRRRIFSEQVFVKRTAKGLEVELDADLLFASGVAEISTEAETLIRHLAGILTPYPNGITVEGHTDNEPIRTLRFPSNWELSAARAVSVVRLLTDSGIGPARLSVQGYGEFQPIADNSSGAGRARNRRVVLVIGETPGAAGGRPSASTMARRGGDLEAGGSGRRGPNPAPQARDSREGV